MNIMPFLMLVAGVVFLPQSSLGNTLIFECAVQNNKSRGWIAPQYVFRIETNPFKAVYSSDASEFKRSRIRTDRKGRYRLQWQERSKATNGQKFWIDYFAKIDPKANTISLRGVFVFRWIANPPESFGNCVLTKK